MAINASDVDETADYIRTGEVITTSEQTVVF